MLHFFFASVDDVHVHVMLAGKDYLEYLDYQRDQLANKNCLKVHLLKMYFLDVLHMYLVNVFSVHN